MLCTHELWLLACGIDQMQSMQSFANLMGQVTGHSGHSPEGAMLRVKSIQPEEKSKDLCLSLAHAENISALHTTELISPSWLLE